MDSGTGAGIQRRAIFKEDSWFSQFRNGSNPWMARYVYALIFLVANLLAWVVRDYSSAALTEMESKICLFCSTLVHYNFIRFFFFP